MSPVHEAHLRMMSTLPVRTHTSAAPVRVGVRRVRPGKPRRLSEAVIRKIKLLGRLRPSMKRQAIAEACGVALSSVCRHLGPSYEKPNYRRGS
jgi:hypothetical protein